MNDQDDLKIARSVLITEAESILKAAERFDSTFKSAIDILDVPNQKIIVTGIGKSGHLGKKISATLAAPGHLHVFYIRQRQFMEIWVFTKKVIQLFFYPIVDQPELLFLNQY